MPNLDHIIPDLRPLAVPLDDVNLDAANARTGHDLDRIAASLHRYGQRKPIVVNRSEGNKIEAGNGTWQAAKSLGWTHIAAVFVEDDPMTAVGYGIADNRLGDLSEWDAETLLALVDGLDPDLGLPTGFDEDELAGVLAELGAGLDDGGGGESSDAEPQINKAEELRKKWGVEPGQLWRLPSRTPGQEHRLICGDCTDEVVVEAVMDIHCHMMVTDPPYGVEYDAAWRDRAAENGQLQFAKRRTGVVHNDERVDWQAAIDLFLGDIIYLWHAGLHAKAAAEFLENANFVVRCQIIWSKPHFVIGRGHYHTRHEPCWYAFRKGKAANWIGGRDQDTVWNITLDKNVEGGHSTQKPVECMARAIRNHEGDVYEPFSGSGTTIIAAENLARQCRAVEIAPGYVAVALQRYQDAFGITPELITETAVPPTPTEAAA